MRTKGVCGMCPDKCDIIATVENGRLIKVEADPDSPRGRVCPRGALSPKIVHSEKRILHPLIRDGEKGSGQFRRATWDEALDYVGEKLKGVMDHWGPDAVASYFGGSAREDCNMMCLAFNRLIGSASGYSCGSTCNFSSNFLTPVTTMGVPTPQLYQDMENSEVVFVWGKNPQTDSGPLPFYRPILRAKKRGAKIIVIDPRGEVLSDIADWWVPVLPGSDGALALAMLKIIIGEGRYDHTFVDRYTRGFDVFRVSLEQQKLDTLCMHCGLSAGEVHRLTDLFCSTEKISLVSYTGLEYQLSGVQNNRAIQILWAITGKLDVPGGLCFGAEHCPTIPLGPADPPHKPAGYDEYPLFSRLSGQGQFAAFPKAVLEGVPYPIRALIVCAASPAVTYPNQPMWHEVYRKLDCLVVLERFMTEDCKYADVILPATTLFENQAVIGIPGGMRMRNRIVQPQGEAKSDVFIFQGIAQRLGCGDKLPKDDAELELAMVKGDRYYLERLRAEPYGITVRPERHDRKYETGLLRADGKPGFPTPSGKFEISSTYLEECGYTGFPEYRNIRSLEGLDGAPGEYPFLLTTAARNSYRFSSFGANIPEIAKVNPAPMLDISPEDAAELGVSNGENVIIETRFGKKSYPVRLTPMARGAVHVPYGGGSSYMPDAWKNGNINDICSWDFHDPLSGFLIFKSLPCKVYKAQPAAYGRPVPTDVPIILKICRGEEHT